MIALAIEILATRQLPQIGLVFAAKAQRHKENKPAPQRFQLCGSDKRSHDRI